MIPSGIATEVCYHQDTFAIEQIIIPLFVLCFTVGVVGVRQGSKHPPVSHPQYLLHHL